MNQKLADESKSISIPEIETEIEQFRKELEQCQQRTKELMSSEKPAEGIFFAKEIFESQQDKLRLEVEIDTRQRKINRMRLGMEVI